MDASFRALSENRIAKITLEIDLANDISSGNKIFADAYDCQTNKAERTDNREALDEIIAKEAIGELSRQLLLETIYMAALARYYENLYSYQSRFALSLYFAQYPEYYSQQSREYNSEQYPEDYSEQYPQYYLEPYISQPWTESFAPPSYHTKHHFSQYLGQRRLYSPHFFNHFLNHSFNHSFDRSATLSSALSPHSSLAHNVISIARHNLGRPVWAFSKFASLCQMGYLGCAATVSELLQHAGLKMNGSASVTGVVNELSNLGWHKIKIYDKHQFQAGDIVYGLKGNHAHIGIITAVDNDKVLVCDNSSSSGTLKERTIESGGSFTPNGRFAGGLYVMREG